MTSSIVRRQAGRKDQGVSLIGTDTVLSMVGGVLMSSWPDVERAMSWIMGSQVRLDETPRMMAVVAKWLVDWKPELGLYRAMSHNVNRINWSSILDVWERRLGQNMLVPQMPRGMATKLWPLVQEREDESSASSRVPR